MPVHVSIHDVTPAFERQVEAALELTRAAGALPALLVVPNYHRAWPLAEHPRFCRRLRELRAAGHEILLHGYFHESPATRRRGSLASRARGFFAQRIVSAGEAEFSDLDSAVIEQRLSDGERALADVGLDVAGFVPPAWTMSRSVIEALGGRGYSYTEDHLSIHDPKEKRSRPSLLLNYASRSRRRMWSTIAYCRTVRSARAILPTRIAIHPADLEVPLLRSELGKLLAWARGDVVTGTRALFCAHRSTGRRGP